MRDDWAAAARQIIERESGRLEDTHVFYTWGPTIVLGATPVAGPPVVLKASSAQNVAIEAATCDRARAAGVPAPEVLACGTDQRLPGEHWFLMERVPGKRWSDRRLSRQGELAILEQLAAHFHALHKVRLPGYGRLTETGAGEHPLLDGVAGRRLHQVS